MNIGIDYISAFGSGGNGTYTRELTKALTRGNERNRFELFTYVHHIFPKQRYADPPGAIFRGVYLPSFSSPALTAAGEVVSAELLRYRAKNLDLVHFTNPLFWISGISRQTRVAVTIHDLAAFKHPEWVKSETANIFRAKLSRIVEQAHTLIAVSQATLHDLAEQFPAAAVKTRVIYEGVDGAFQPLHATDGAFLKRYALLKPYVLSVGEIQPRKNLKGLLAAFAGLSKDMQRAYDLVLVGAPRNAAALQTLQETIRQSGLENSVRVLGYLSHDDLVRIYTHAKAFVFLSYAEGFGLPVLESMACGIPTLASSTPALREIGGNGCVYADPNDAVMGTARLAEILLDEKLRQELKHSALQRAAIFSWDKAARETLGAYANAMQGEL